MKGHKAININKEVDVKVKLTRKGKDIYLSNHTQNMLESKANRKGYYRFQFHELMFLYGNYLYAGRDIVFENQEIFLRNSDLK